LLGRYDDAIAYLLRYVDLAEQTGTPADLPVVYGYLGVAYGRVGSWQRAIDAGQRGVELAADRLTGAMHTVARMQLAFIYAELHEWEQVLQVVEPVRATWREEGMSPHAFMLRAVTGLAMVHRGRRDAGLGEIQSALQWAQEVDHRLLVHVVYLRLAQAQVYAGQTRVAQQTAKQAEALAAKAGDPWAEAVAWRTQGEAAMRLAHPDWSQIEGQLIRARDRLRQIRTRPDLARTYLVMRRLYDRAGQVAWAVDCHFRATTIFDELGMLDELRDAQGRPAGERRGAVVLPGLQLRGPNVSLEESPELP
jgi:tetratricopeptide (TPR) repeat protein